MKKSFLFFILFSVLICFSACEEEVYSGYDYYPETELRSEENSGGFHKEYKIIYKYDEKGNVINKTEYTKGFFGIFNVRERQYDIEYTYNENGNISQERIRQEEFNTHITDGHYIYEDGYNYIYNEKNQLIKKEVINPSSFENSFCGYEYEYDNQGNLVKEYTCFTDGKKELEFENIYDLQNRLITKKDISNFGTSSWLSNETNYTYDVDGKLIYSKTVRYAHYKGEKNSYSEKKYYYDEFDRLIKQQTNSFNSDGKLTDKYVTEYKDFVRQSKSD